MTREQILVWLKELGVKVPSSQQRSNWVVCECVLGPWRHSGGQSASDVCGVKIRPGESVVMCFACDYHDEQTALLMELRRLEHLQPSGRTYDFPRLMQLIAQAEEGAEYLGIESPDIEEVLFGKDAGPHVFPDWWLDSFIKWDQSVLACNYLQKRGVLLKVNDFLDVRFDSSEQRVCFPVRDFSGRLVGLHGRAVKDGVEPRYRMYKQGGRNNPIYWLGEHWVDLSRPVVVVEGPMDVASVLRVYDNVVSPLFSNPNVEKLRRMGAATEIVTFLDRGTGGDKGRDKLTRVLGDSVLVSHVLPPHPWDDPGEMPQDAVAEALRDFITTG